MAEKTAPSPRLLVIDDEIAITRVVQQVALALNFNVRSLTTPARAVDEFIEFRPDIVLLDMVMPERDGLEILDELLLTGIPSKLVLACEFGRAYILLAEGIARFHRAEIAAVLRKPFRRDILKQTLTAVIAGHGVAADGTYTRRPDLLILGQPLKSSFRKTLLMQVPKLRTGACARHAERTLAIGHSFGHPVSRPVGE